jgi:hypothetical protein
MEGAASRLGRVERVTESAGARERFGPERRRRASCGVADADLGQHRHRLAVGAACRVEAPVTDRIERRGGEAREACGRREHRVMRPAFAVDQDLDDDRRRHPVAGVAQEAAHAGTRPSQASRPESVHI